MNPDQVTAKAEMLIRKPVAEVFEAFIDPAITSNFWFTKSSGRLEAGQQVGWEWEMYGVSAPVDVKTIEQNRRIVIEWPGSTVEWLFTPKADDQTFVSITISGFSGTPDEVVAGALDAVDGFTNVLCGLKAYLEHGIRLNLIADRHPEALVS